MTIFLAIIISFLIFMPKDSEIIIDSYSYLDLFIIERISMLTNNEAYEKAEKLLQKLAKEAN